MSTGWSTPTEIEQVMSTRWSTPTEIEQIMSTPTDSSAAQSSSSAPGEGGVASPTPVLNPRPTTQASLPPSTASQPPNVTSPSPPPPSPNTSVSWERLFLPALTESSVQLHDLNNDGTLDVVVVNGFSVCEVTLVVLEGTSGDILWQRNITFEIFAVKCGLDVNSDSTPDCLVAGRGAGFAAVSGVDGRVLWSVDPTIAFPQYNFYFPLVTMDLDGDGVPDLINVHGGDTTYKPKETERSPAFLVVVSGRTGQKLMERVPMPDGRESYTSPVLHTFADNLEVVLLGTGGETLSGSLWAVSMDSIQRRVHQFVTTSEEYANYEIFTEYTNRNTMCSHSTSDSEIEALRPKFEPSDYSVGRGGVACPRLGVAEAVGNTFGLCVYRVLQSQEKGVMLPPVMVDMTGDGHNDLVVSTFYGHTMLLDGRDGTVVWDTFLPGTETYRSVCTHTHTHIKPNKGQMKGASFLGHASPGSRTGQGPSIASHYQVL